MTELSGSMGSLDVETTMRGGPTDDQTQPWRPLNGFRRRLCEAHLLKPLSCSHRPRHRDPLLCEYARLRVAEVGRKNRYGQSHEAWLAELENRVADGWGPFDIRSRFGECTDARERGAITRGLIRRAQRHPDDDVAGLWARAVGDESRRQR